MHGLWRRGVVLITTAKRHSAKPNLRSTNLSLTSNLVCFHLTFTCSNSTTETLEKDVKYVQR